MRIPVVAIIRGSLTGSRSLRRRSIVAEDLAEDLVDLINMALLGNQSRRADAGITGEFDMQTAIEEALRRIITAQAGLRGGRQIDTAEHAVAADIGDRLDVLERIHPLKEIVRHFCRPLEQAFL